MVRLVVHLIGPGHQVAVEITQRPDGMLLRIDSFGDLANVFRQLGIAREGMHKLSVGRAKKPLND
jgi:hypothetical protein